MHALLCTSGSTGDLLPMLGLAQQLQSRGITPVIAVAGSYREIVEQHGFEFFELFDSVQHRKYIDERTAARGIDKVKIGIRRVADDLEPGFQLVQEYVEKRGHEVVVISTGWMVGTRVAQEVFGVPMVTVDLQPMAVRSIQQYPGLARWLAKGFSRMADNWIDGQIAAPINAFRARFGLKPVTKILKDWWLSPDLIIGMFPDWICPPQSDWPSQLQLVGFQWNDQLEPVPASEVERLSQFLADGEAPLVFSRCSAIDYGSQYFETCIAAARQLGKRAVLLTPNLEELPSELGDGVAHFKYLPLSEILPHACGHLHHGGIGTVAQSLRAGVPQLIVPQIMDQPDNARRILGLGVGERLAPKLFSESRVVAKLNQLLGSETTREKCRDYAQRCQEMDGLRDGTEVICKMLEHRTQR